MVYIVFNLVTMVAAGLILASLILSNAYEGVALMSSIFHVGGHF